MAFRDFCFEINNKSSGMKTVGRIYFYGLPENGGDMVWLSHCFGANLFTEGNEVEVSFMITCRGEIRECGVHLLFFEEEGEVFQYFSTIQRSWDQNLSPYEPDAVTMSPPAATSRTPAPASVLTLEAQKGLERALFSPSLGRGAPHVMMMEDGYKLDERARGGWHSFRNATLADVQPIKRKS